MPRDVQLPNGTIMENVPDSISKYGIMEKAIRKGYATAEDFGQAKQEEYSATEGSSFGQNLLEGTGRGMANIGRNVANIAGVEGYSDEDLRDKSALDEDLMSTGGGFVGNLIGETVATLPVGGLAGRGVAGVAKGLQAARGAAGAAGAAQVGGRVGAGQLAARGAVEGASVGALAAGPDNRGMGALIGGGAGAAMSGLGSVLRRGREGLVKTSDEAVDLIKDAAARGVEIDLPVTAAGKKGGLSGVIKGAYEKLFPHMPLAGGALRSVAAKANKDYAEVVIRDAAPEGFTKSLRNGDTVQEIVKDMSQAYKRGFKETVGSYQFNGADEWVDPAIARLQGKADELGQKSVDAVSDNLRRTLGKYSDDGIIDGADLGTIKASLRRQAGEVADTRMAEAYEEAIRGIDDMVEQQLSYGGNPQNMADLQKYKQLIGKFGHYLDLSDVSRRAGAKDGMFTPQEYLRTVIARNKGEAIAQGTGRGQRMAENAADLLSTKGGQQDVASRLMTYAALGSASSMGGAPIAAGSVGLARALSGKGGQRAMLGNTNVQRGLSEALKRGKLGANVSTGSQAAGALLRRGTAGTLAEENQ